MPQTTVAKPIDQYRRGFLGRITVPKKLVNSLKLFLLYPSLVYVTDMNPIVRGTEYWSSFNLIPYPLVSHTPKVCINKEFGVFGVTERESFDGDL